MDKQNGLKLSPLHFSVAIALFALITYLVGAKSFGRESSGSVPDLLTELSEDDFADSIASGQCFVLFYVENSASCGEMNRNLNRLAANKPRNVKFFKCNIEKNPDQVARYAISGVPNIYLFKNGEESNRVMGVVSADNLQVIYNHKIN